MQGQYSFCGILHILLPVSHIATPPHCHSPTLQFSHTATGIPPYHNSPHCYSLTPQRPHHAKPPQRDLPTPQHPLITTPSHCNHHRQPLPYTVTSQCCYLPILKATHATTHPHRKMLTPKHACTITPTPIPAHTPTSTPTTLIPCNSHNP